MVGACGLFTTGVHGQTYSVGMNEYFQAAGNFDPFPGECPVGWISNGNYSRTDVASSVSGSLEKGTTNDGRVEHCGECPIGTMALELTASFEGTNESTKEVAGSVSGGVPGVVDASLESGMSWANGDVTTIQGSATISGVQPCQFQEGQFTFDFYKDKGRKVTHSYGGEAVANTDPTSEGCNYENGDKIQLEGATTVSTNLGNHYFSASTNYQSTVGGTCNGCVPGTDPDCDDEENENPPPDDADTIPRTIPQTRA